ncbi:MAG TPA: hypothetical protein VMZ53_05940 [Kofleriaceae bacterium]|nr:hypothetical protein [Kofleriaceae bacterium]
MSATSCITPAQPISWLRLETFAIDRRDAAVKDHVAACPACKACLDEIERDVVALPPLVVPVAREKKPRWWRFAIPVGVALAAAAALLLVIRPRDESLRSNETRVKGVGIVVVDVVRERSGTIRDDVRTFRDGDRFKVVVTCPPDRSAHFEVRVREPGAQTIDRPLQPVDLVCGNRVVMPGAFTLTGTNANEVCVDVTGPQGETKTACVTLRPE